MLERKTTPERLGAFSDAVVAVIITVAASGMKARPVVTGEKPSVCCR